jgi:hypothetical protein
MFRLLIRPMQITHGPTLEVQLAPGGTALRSAQIIAFTPADGWIRKIIP